MGKYLYSLFITIIISFLLSSCEVSVSTANIDNVKVCNSLNGKLCESNASVFNTTDPVIYSSCNLNNAPENTSVKFTWRYTHNEKPILIDEIVLNSSDKGINLDLNCSLSKPYNDWPAGSYEVEVSILESAQAPIIKFFEIR